MNHAMTRAELTEKILQIRLDRDLTWKWIAERGPGEKVWGSMVKQALKRRKPGFNESYYGYRAFSDLLEEAEKKGLIKLEPDEKSGGYVVRPA